MADLGTSFVLLEALPVQGMCMSHPFDVWWTFPSDFFIVDKNSLTGSLDFLCDSPLVTLEFVVSDCSGNRPEISCHCCDRCCSDADSESKGRCIAATRVLHCQKLAD